MSSFIIIDGNAILHRAYHAMPPLTTSKGELVNAVFGFTSMLLRIFSQFHPEYAAVCFDKKAPTFRKEKYKPYQAKRPKMVKELVGQVKRVHQVVSTMNIPIFEKDGFEADDVIGTLVKQAGKLTVRAEVAHEIFSGTNCLRSSKICELPARQIKKDIETIIVTGDRDLLQLVDEKAKVYMPVKGLSQATLFDKEAVKEKMGVLPPQIPDLKGLIGDQADNYPGVSGNGPRTALGLLGTFGTLKNIYKNLEKIPPAVAEKLKKGKEDAEMSYCLATIIKDVPVKLELEKCKLTDYDWEKVAELFDELEFKSLIPRLPKDPSAPFGSTQGKSSGQVEKPVEEEEKQEEQMGLF